VWTLDGGTTFSVRHLSFPLGIIEEPLSKLLAREDPFLEVAVATRWDDVRRAVRPTSG
jgi:hypothetical protein